jgi:cysteine desulfurase / selenocysteine lyase
MYDIQKLREVEFPLSAETIYFNHAAISPLPTRSRNAMLHAVQELSKHPLHYFAKEGMSLNSLFPSRVGELISAKNPTEVVWASNTGLGLQSVAQSIPLQPGENICFCDMEFPTNAYTWMGLERAGAGEVRLIPAVDGGLTLDALRQACDKKTRVVAVSAVQFFSGHRTDLAALGAFCRERNILFVVDAIQSVGHMKIDVQAMNIDVLVSGGQKSLLGPLGAGFLYVRDEVAEALTPRLVYANGTQGWDFWLDYDLTPLPGAARFSMGAPDIVALAGGYESVGLLLELGQENIDQHTTELADILIDELTNLGYTVVTPRHSHGPIVTFATGLDLAGTDQLIAHLDERGISVVKQLAKNGQPHLRISLHCYNIEEELYQFLSNLKEYNP